jgi:hypothetical protein
MEDRVRSLIVRTREAFSARPRLVLAACVAAGVTLLFLSVSKHDAPPPRESSPAFTPAGALTSGEFHPATGLPSLIDSTKQFNTAMPAAVPSKLYSSAPIDSANAYREPQVAYSAELTVATRDFLHSRTTLEEILDRHHGYVAKLRMVGEPAGSILSATLRVPSSEYRSALSELKAVGAVEHEEEAADEITQQHSELEARLVNAQNEERASSESFRIATTKTNSPILALSNARWRRSAAKSSASKRSAPHPVAAFLSPTFSSPSARSAPRQPKRWEPNFTTLR